jgi:hypothetical protein
VAYAQPGLQLGAPILGGLSVGRSSVLLYDAALRVKVPLTGALPISPFVQAGAGAIRQSFDLAGISPHATNTAYNLGAGADVSLGSRLGLQLMAKDYIGRIYRSVTVFTNRRTREKPGRTWDCAMDNRWPNSQSILEIRIDSSLR